VLVNQIKVNRVELDELWAIVQKKLPRLAEGQAEAGGSWWIWIALASEHRLILAAL